MSSRERARVSERTQVALVRFMQVVMACILVVGLAVGNVEITVNAVVGLAVTRLPTALEHRYGISLDAWIVLWMTTAVFLHAFGTLSLPELGILSPYRTVWWWDHVTHMLSSSLVVAAGYAATRGLAEYTDAIEMGPRFTVAYLLVFVMAFGVLWELVEFYVDILAALLGMPEVLTQYGLEDTILDLWYNTVGGLLAAAFGTAYLRDVATQLAALLRREADER